MESALWAIRTRDAFSLLWPLAVSAFVIWAVAQCDVTALLVVWYWRLFTGAKDPIERRRREGLSGLVIIPSLLRNGDDLRAITITVDSCASNEYPGDLVIVASVDGKHDAPELFEELCQWIRDGRQRFPSNVKVYVGGTETRLGKMMAVEAGIALMKTLVASGEEARFPDIYFSVDGDGTLGPRALERLADRLATPHPITGRLRRVVSGKICIRPDAFWRGATLESLRRYFTVEGQIHWQVAREFVLSNVARFNWKLTPKIGIPGALYCTWSEIILTAPRYMGFMKTITLAQWVGWWIGRGPPRFSESSAPPCAEALTGASDDTCIAFLASIASWKDGVLSFDAPNNPAIAFVRFLRACLWERSHDYAPEARVYTYTPSTLNGIWTQRVRWNSSRFECSGRFWRAFAFHWDIGLPTGAHLWQVLIHVFTIVAYYVVLPYYVLAKTSGVTAYVLGYAMQATTLFVFTCTALLMEREWRRYWPVLFALPLAPLHCICINSFGCIYGVVRDVFLFGNATKFAPEWTLRKGGTERIAMLFRMRRALALAVRAVVRGDVPLGAFWLGWRETQWTPSGYDGWTTGRAPRAIVPSIAAWFQSRRRARR
jgi:hypothetical protein